MVAVRESRSQPRRGERQDARHYITRTGLGISWQCENARAKKAKANVCFAYATQGKPHPSITTQEPGIEANAERHHAFPHPSHATVRGTRDIRG